MNTIKLNIVQLFHGSEKNFKKINLKFAERGNYERYGKAIYFSDNIDVARGYGSNLFTLNLITNNMPVIDCKGAVIRSKKEEVERRIKEGVSFIVKNTRDGAQYSGQNSLCSLCCDGENHTKCCSAAGKKRAYKYITGYAVEAGKYVNHKIKKLLTNEEIETIKPYAKDYCALDIIIFLKDKKAADALTSKGIKVLVNRRTAPVTANTYVITNQKVISSATRLQ